MAERYVQDCRKCFGCGHLCTRCALPISVCDCLLDTEEMEACSDCNGTGELSLKQPVRPIEAQA